ncbi:MAG: peroxiredoxin [Deltaproteobacteria bacterium]|nr:MAG: peroxiredoxin [Deltaproteobacteria bacterium]
MIQVGQKAPDFKATAALGNDEFKPLSLADYKGKWLVLFFYPLDFTFVCPTEINAFSDEIEKFKGIGAEILGVSVDSQFSHNAWMKVARKEGGIEGLKYPLLADVSKTIAQDYGVLLPAGIALRGLFVIDPEGVLQYQTVNFLNFGRSTEETLRVVQAIQMVKQSGEVCPANWKPGSATMKADPVKSKEYFSTVK